VTLFLQFIAFAVAAVYLEPALLGAYTFAVALAALFRLLPAFSFDAMLTRELTQQPRRESLLVPNAAYVRLILAAAAYLGLAATLALGGYDDLTTKAGLIAGLVLPMVALDTFRNSLGIRLRLGWTSIADALEGALTLAGALLIAAGGGSVFAFLWLYVAAKAVNGLVLLLAARRLATLDFRPRRDAWLPLLRAAAPLALATMLIAFYFRIDMILLARLKPAADVGQYGAAYKFLDTILLVPALVMAVLSPVIARSVVEEPQLLRRRYRRSLALMTTAALGIAVLGGMTATRVVPALPGFGAYHGAGRALAVLSLAAALSFLAAVVHATLIASHRQRRLIQIALVAIVVNVVLNATLIPPYSYMGAAWATVSTEVVVLALSFLAIRPLNLGFPLGALARAAAAAVILAIVLAATYRLPALVQAVLGLVVYLGAVVATGAVDRSELRLFLRPA